MKWGRVTIAAVAFVGALLCCPSRSNARMEECIYPPRIPGYVNKSGECVPRPRSGESLPDGVMPTAICVNGKYSYSKSRSGTCSRNGGVKVWL